MRVEIIYSDDHAEVHIDEIVELLAEREEEVTDKQISEAISEYIDEAVSEGPWPSYRLGHGDRESLMEAIKEALEERKESE